jgi:hypothetical protein
LDQEKVLLLKERAHKEQLELDDLVIKGIVKQDEMMGRQSGSLAWRSVRGETRSESKSMQDINWGRVL